MRLKVLLLVVSAARFLSAGPIQPGTPACAPGSLASYIALSPAGCVIGVDFQLNKFGFAVVAFSGPGSPTDATQIMVTPLMTGLTAGLLFSSNSFQVTGSQSATYLVTYSGDPVIRSVTETIDPPPVIPPGSVSVTTNICLGTVFPPSGICPGPNATLTVSDNGISPMLTASVSFQPVTIFGIRETIQLDAHGATAGFTTVNNVFELVPEPQSGLLCAIVLLGMLGWHRNLFRRL